MWAHARSPHAPPRSSISTAERNTPTTRRCEGRRRRCNSSPHGPQHQQAAAASPPPTRRALALPPLPSPCSLCYPNASTKHCCCHYRGRTTDLPTLSLFRLDFPYVWFTAARHGLAFTCWCWSVATLASPQRSLELPSDSPTTRSHLHFPVSIHGRFWLLRDLGVVFAHVSILLVQ
jgi:hypothetical protein